MYSYQDCYKILSIESDCDWAEVRKAYKQKIQKWHPDRITDSAMKSSAEDKLKELNLAYEQLSGYYKTHGSLPIQDQAVDFIQDEPVTEASRPRPRSKPAQKTDSSYKSRDPAAPQAKQPRTLIPLVIFTVIGLSIYAWLDVDKANNHSTNEQESNPQAPENNEFSENLKTDSNTTSDTPVSSKDYEVSQTEESYPDGAIEYFTIGSSVGEVLQIQGPPDSVAGNIWFYGESSIEFEDGVVKDWKRTAEYPLKAHIDL
jgi:hypothetical protein